MGGSSSPQMMPTYTAQNQQQTRDPWSPAVPALTTALQGAQDAYNNTYNGPQVASMDPNVTAGQNQILANSAAGLSTSGATSALGGLQGVLANLGLTSQQTAGANATQGAINNLAAIASGAYLDPTKDPNFAKSLQDSLDQTANSVNAQFSAAGRYGSGAQTDTLARDLGNTASTAYANQYNTNVNNMMNANSQTGSLASSLAGIGQSGVGNLYGAGSALGDLSTAQNTAASNQIGIGGQRMDYQQQLIDSANQAPWTKVGNLAQIASGIGGLGGTSSTTSQGVQYAPQQNTQPSTLQSVLGGGISGLGSLANVAKAGGFAAMFSDERLKENIEKIGRTDDGQNLYSYSYKTDPLKRKQIGLLAQEVEEKKPDAVGRHPSGFLMVDYGKALKKKAA